MRGCKNKKIAELSGIYSVNIARLQWGRDAFYRRPSDKRNWCAGSERVMHIAQSRRGISPLSHRTGKTVWQ